jgi:hypothetical protein
MVVLGIKYPAFWKSLKRVASQRTIRNRRHGFLVLNRVLRPFWRFLVWPKPDPLVVCGKIEPRLIKSDDELPTLMFD